MGCLCNEASAGCEEGAQRARSSIPRSMSCAWSNRARVCWSWCAAIPKHLFGGWTMARCRSLCGWLLGQALCSKRLREPVTALSTYKICYTAILRMAASSGLARNLMPFPSPSGTTQPPSSRQLPRIPPAAPALFSVPFLGRCCPDVRRSFLCSMLGPARQLLGSAVRSDAQIRTPTVASSRFY